MQLKFFGNCPGKSERLVSLLNIFIPFHLLMCVEGLILLLHDILVHVSYPSRYLKQTLNGQSIITHNITFAQNHLSATTYLNIAYLFSALLLFKLIGYTVLWYFGAVSTAIVFVIYTIRIQKKGMIRHLKNNEDIKNHSFFFWW